MDVLERAAVRVEESLVNVGEVSRRADLPAREDFYATAARLVALGINVIPIEQGAKRSAVPWRDMQDERLRDQPDEFVDTYLDRFWGPGKGLPYALGIVAGAVSGLVVVDTDGPSGQALYDALAGDVKTVTIQTRSGNRHYWFQHPGVQVRNRAKVQGVRMDVRADRGIAVVPPTLGYRWIVSPFSHEWPAGMWPPAQLPSRLSRALWPARRRLEPHPLTQGPEAILKHSSDERYAWVALEREADEVRRAPEGVRNHQLNSSAFAVARFFDEGKLSEEDARRVLLEAALMAGLDAAEAHRTITSAFEGRRRK